MWAKAQGRFIIFGMPGHNPLRLSIPAVSLNPLPIYIDFVNICSCMNLR